MEVFVSGIIEDCVEVIANLDMTERVYSIALALDCCFSLCPGPKMEIILWQNIDIECTSCILGAETVILSIFLRAHDHLLSIVSRLECACRRPFLVHITFLGPNIFVVWRIREYFQLN